MAPGAHDPAKYASIRDQTLAWGLTLHIGGDAMEPALAMLPLPAAWRLAGPARA